MEAQNFCTGAEQQQSTTWRPTGRNSPVRLLMNPLGVLSAKVEASPQSGPAKQQTAAVVLVVETRATRASVMEYVNFMSTR